MIGSMAKRWARQARGALALAALGAGLWTALARAAEAGEAQYLIITTEAAKAGFEELAAYRASPEGGGYRTRVLTVEEIHRTRAESEPEARIRGAIEEAYRTQGTQFVVLGARADAIAPVRVYTPVTGIQNGWTQRFGTPSDAYYACLEAPWPRTETGLYGYGDFSALDLTAEVHLGRIPAADAESARRYVRRLRRFQCAASPLALRADRVLLHGLAMGNTPIADWGKAAARSDGYPWINEAAHPAGAVDSELWLRNIYLSRMLPHNDGLSLDLYLPNACSDPQTRSGFTEALSIDRSADLNVYLAQRPEFVAISSHGLPGGVGRLGPLSGMVPGNGWGVLYTVGCNTVQFDEASLRDGGSETNMALPEEGGFDGGWRFYALAEHTLLGSETSGGLVYIASTREGYRVDGVGGIGGDSYELLAAFAEMWAQGGKCVGEIFSEHKLSFIERARQGLSMRSLFVGTTLFGDPALRPLREVRAAAQPLRAVFVMGEEVCEREVWPGMTLGEAAPEAERAGQVLAGWVDDAGAWVEAGTLLASSGPLRFSARWREATAAECAPVSTAAVLLAEAFDWAGGSEAVAGRSLAPSSKTAPWSGTFALGQEARWICFQVRQEPGFDNDEVYGVVGALVGSAHRLEVRRRKDLGWSVVWDEAEAVAVPIAPSVWHQVAIRVSADETRLYVDGEARGVFGTLGEGTVKLVLGANAEGQRYGWAQVGTLYLDALLVLADQPAWEVGELLALQRGAPEKVPVRRVLPEAEGLRVPADGAEQVALQLAGRGQVAPEAGGMLPEIHAPRFPEVRFPEGGYFWTGADNLRQMGLDMFTWEAPEGESTPAGWLAVAKPELRVTAMAVAVDGSVEVSARVSSALPVKFGERAGFCAVPRGEGEAVAAASAEVQGAEAVVRLPPEPGAQTRLFRLRVR